MCGGEREGARRTADEKETDEGYGLFVHASGRRGSSGRMAAIVNVVVSRELFRFGGALVRDINMLTSTGTNINIFKTSVT